MQEDDFGMDIGLGEEPGQSKDKIEEEYYFEVRTPLRIRLQLRITKFV